MIWQSYTIGAKSGRWTLMQKKCHVIKFGKSGMRPDWENKLGNDRLQESEKEKDLGVGINNRLSPEEHIQEKVGNMHNLLANMRVVLLILKKKWKRK